LGLAAHTFALKTSLEELHHNEYKFKLFILPSNNTHTHTNMFSIKYLKIN